MAWHQKPKGKVDLAREQAKVGRFMNALAEQWALMPVDRTRDMEAKAAARLAANRRHYG